MLNAIYAAWNRTRKIAKGITFRNPPRSQVVVFDRQGSEFISKTVLYDIPHTVLSTRFEESHITPKIVFHFLWSLIKAGPRPAGELLRHPYRGYLLACLEYIDPAMVITVIDNSYTFQRLSQIYPRARFASVQNGVRIRTGIIQSQISAMGDFYCFGAYERDLYNDCGIEADAFFPVGSLKGGYYWTAVKDPMRTEDYEICLISQWRRPVMNGNQALDFRESLHRMHEYLDRYLGQSGATACIAACSINKEDLNLETAYYRSIFGDKVDIIEHNAASMSSYAAADRSRVVVVLDSTLGREVFGWGKKVLFCNYTNWPERDCPCPGVWALNSGGFEEFKQRLDELRRMGRREYEEISMDSRRYLMNYDFAHPPHQVLRQMIEKAITEKAISRRNSAY